MSSPSQSSNSSVLAEIYKYNPSSVIELYELSLSPLSEYYASKGAPISPQVYRFHNGYNEKFGTVSPNVQWDGNSYSARPILMEGVQASSSGEIARPTFQVANHDWTFTQLNKAYANLIGAKVTRIRTLVKFIDSANFQTRNLLINSQNFETWTQSSNADTDVSANVATAPDGTLTADKLYEATTTSSSHSVVKAVTGLADNTLICFSVYLKAGERQYAVLAANSKASSTGAFCRKSFDLVNGTAGSENIPALAPSILSSGIAPVGNGWYRCWIVTSTLSGSPDRIPQYSIFIDNNSDPSVLTYAGTINSGIYIWGAQAEVCTNPTRTPTTYQVTGATAGNPTADPNAKFPDDVFVIDRMSEEIPGQVTYELAPAWDVEGVQLPRRQVVANICPWTYKADPCNWAYNGLTQVISPSGTCAGSATLTSAVVSPSSNLLTVTGVTGTIRENMTLVGPNILPNTKIAGQISGTTGGAGQYSLSKVQPLLSSPTLATSAGTYTRIPIKSSTKLGTNATLNITIPSPAPANYTTATVTVNNPGGNYSTVSETLTIDGANLSGVSGTNDLTVNVSGTNATFINENDLIVSTASEDRCGKRLTSCRARFGTRALPFGGFPSAGLYGKPI